jgi:crossover junction endodeoxyribonuclease RuvC
VTAPAAAIGPVTRWLGIDPGLAGGLAVLDLDAGRRPVEVHLFRTPVVRIRRGKKSRLEYDVRAMWALLRDLTIADAPPLVVELAIEAGGARPRQGVASTYRTGLGSGLWLALAVASGIPYRIVPPQVWKRAYGLLGASKAASRLRATEVCPSLGPLRAVDEGPAEALLLAAYLSRTAPSSV